MTSASAEQQNVDCLLLNGTIVTMDSAGTIIDGGAVAIAGTNIVAVGRADDLRVRFRASAEVECGGCVILPGLINGHAHVPMSLLRGLVADVQLDVWLYGYMFPVESKFADAAFVYAGTRLSCAEMIRSGTTTFCDMYYFEDQVARAVDESGMRAICGQSVMRFATPDAPSYDAGLERARAFIHAWKNHGRIIPAIAPHAPYTCTDEIYREAVALAREYNVPLVTHLSETARELKESLESVQRSPVAYAESVGAFEVKAIAAHCVHTDDRDWAILRSHGVGAVPCPSSNLKLASGVAPYAEMLAAGVTVGIGTDGPASNDDQDLFTDVHFAAMLPKGLGNDPTLVPAKQALQLATSQGAKAVHLDDIIGSIEPGKRADIIVVEMRGVHTTPRYRYSPDAIYNYLVYATRGSDVRDTIVDGRFLMRDRVLQTLDEAEVKREAQAIADRIDAFLRERETNLLDKILAIGGVRQAEQFEVQVKAQLVDEARLLQALEAPDITITKASERTQYDTYFMFADGARGRVRYREDHRHDPGARPAPKYALTLTVPTAGQNEISHTIVLSRARYTAPAEQSLRFYREYFGADRVVEVDKQRRRWRIDFKGEDFAINFDRLVGHHESGPFLEIKSRTWSRRDAEHKAALIEELLQRFGIAQSQLVHREYVEM